VTGSVAASVSSFIIHHSAFIIPKIHHSKLSERFLVTAQP